MSLAILVDSMSTIVEPVQTFLFAALSAVRCPHAEHLAKHRGSRVATSAIDIPGACDTVPRMKAPGKILRNAALAFWSRAYLLSEAELGFVVDLPAHLQKYAPDWPVEHTVAIDVGASVGVYTRAFAKWCAMTIALEPNAAAARVLRNCELRHVEIIEAAAGAQASDGILSDTSAGGWRHPTAGLGTGGAWQHPCRIVPLHQLSLPASGPLVVKIDVEGAELDVLEGMGALLQRHHLLLLIELEHRPGARPDAAFDLLCQSGLSAFQWRGQKLVPAHPEDIPHKPEHGAPRFARLRGYRNNFIFLRNSG